MKNFEINRAYLLTKNSENMESTLRAIINTKLEKDSCSQEWCYIVITFPKHLNGL